MPISGMLGLTIASRCFILYFFHDKKVPKNLGWLMLLRALPNLCILEPSQASWLGKNAIDSAFTPAPVYRQAGIARKPACLASGEGLANAQ